MAADIDPKKLDLARQLGAEIVVDASAAKPAEAIRAIGGAHVVLCLAPAASAILQAFAAVRRGGTLVLVGLPSGEFTLPILGTVAKGVRILTSAVGTRQDLRELLSLAAGGRIKTVAETARLGQINEVFERMRSGRISGRVVIEFPAA